MRSERKLIIRGQKWYLFGEESRELTSVNKILQRLH